MIGTEWVLAQLHGSPPATVGGAAGRPRLRLDAADKRVTGFTGVNTFNGRYELSGDALAFAGLASTRRGGASELMRQETAFLDALQATARVRAGGSSLHLFNAAGAELARFDAAGVTR